MANISWLGANYQNVDTVYLPETGTGNEVPFYLNGGGSSGYIRTVVVPEQTVTPIYRSDGNTNGYSAQLNNVTEMFEQWSEYIVTFNGTEYYFTTIVMWGNNYLFGEQGYLWSGGSGTNYPYPFCVISTSVNDSYIYTASADSVTVKIEKLELTGSGGGGGSYTWETKSDQDITITTDGTYNYAIWTYTEPLQANETYRITWGENGTEYICKTVADSSGSSLVYDGYYLGNASIVSEGEDTGEPFLIYRNTATRIVATTNRPTGTWHIKVEKQVEISATLITKTITTNGTYSATDDNADGYSSVTVNVPSGASSVMNVQAYMGMDYAAATSYTATDVTLTVAKTGTYNVSWMGFRNTNSGTNGSQLYVNGSARGSAYTTFTSTYGQSVEMTGISLNEGDVLVVRARARNTSYRMYVGNLIIEQTA